MKKEFEIKTVADFLAVPEEKLDECMRDFEHWVKLARAMGELLGHGVMVVDRFVWVDDGQPGVSSVEVVVGRTE